MKFDRETVNEIILRRLQDPTDQVQGYAEVPGDGFRPITVGEDRSVTLRLAAALHARGRTKGQAVAILAGVRHEWVQWDFANLLARLVTIGIYPTSTPDQVLYLLQHSESRVLVLENQEQLNSLTELLPECPTLELIISLDGELQSPAPQGIELLSMTSF